MMFRTYGRRGRGLERSYSGANSFAYGVSESSSQECPQDVYDFSFPSQESNRRQCSDPYSVSSSQDSRKLGFLPVKSKKAKVIEIDSEQYGSSSSQESKDFGVLEISERDFKKSEKLNSDPYEYKSSEECEEFAVRPPKKFGKDRVFDFSEDEDILKPKQSKNFGSDSYGLTVSNVLADLGIPPSRKRKESDGVSGKSKKKGTREIGVLQKKKKNKKIKAKESEESYVELTATLMETQEHGEMMEHEDEVNFALDGLKRGQPVRIRRASLLSLLTICGTIQQRRQLRVHGMTKTITDSVMGLTLDDQPSNLAAAALLYILTSDGQDDHILHSPSCIRFLIKLLKPQTSNATKNKSLPVGSKLLGLCKSAGLLQESASGADSSFPAIMLKVREILLNCKEMKAGDECKGAIGEAELNPKWISLVMMEKSCTSSISLEDSSGMLRKTGASFKEKLREYGGLDAVFELARSCHLIMEEWLQKNPTFALESKDCSVLESLVLLLKCLKIMENATFLSNDNQCHLLQMKGNFDGQKSARSFTKLVLNIINSLSVVPLSRGSSGKSRDEKTGDGSNRDSNSGNFEPSMEGTEASTYPLSLKTGVESSKAGARRGAPSNMKKVAHTNGLETQSGNTKRSQISTDFEMEDSQDPFAFDENESEPSKWDVLSRNVKDSLPLDSKAMLSEYKDRSRAIPIPSQEELSNMETCHSQEPSCSSAVDENKSNLAADCLLTAIKALMNLTNDNPEGCRQIAMNGGLEILSSLLAGHFPSFYLNLPHLIDVRKSGLNSKSSTGVDQQGSTSLSDQELDFLVATLGLLVNLVEKDGRNRSRLAAISVSLPSLEGFGTKQKSDVISLLCSIFLANQGNSEDTGEEKHFSLEDEDSVLQGEKEAEKMIVEAYSALLLAFLSMESNTVRNAIAKCLPSRNLKILVPVLERFVEFHLSLNVISPETHTAVLEVIESCRIP